jgi:DnaK suppressor protein
MTEVELGNLKTALEAKRLELVDQLRGLVAELTIEPGQPELIGRIESMNNRDKTAGMIGRFSSTLADVDRSLRAFDENCYGGCMRCHRPIAVSRLQSIPWATYCVRCKSCSRPRRRRTALRISMSRRQRRILSEFLGGLARLIRS